MRVKLKKYEHIFERLAQREGCSVAEIKASIEASIEQGLESSDPKLREQWEKVPCKGAKPTPEEALAYAVKSMRKPGGKPFVWEYIVY